MGDDWSQPPEWFKKRDYGYLQTLDAPGWQFTLGQCARLRNDTFARLAGRPTFSEEWDPVLGPEMTKDASFAFIGLPPVTLVDKVDQAALRDLEKPAVIVLVSLRATDNDIIEGFKKVLRDARRDLPGPARKPGPMAFNAKFDETIFDRWMRHKIVQLCQLDEWRSTLSEKEHPTNADFGRWLFDDRDYQDKLIFDAFKMLESAIAEIPALTLQVGRVAEQQRLPAAHPQKAQSSHTMEGLTKNSG
jgi:hypothetical protein